MGEKLNFEAAKVLFNEQLFVIDSEELGSSIGEDAQEASTLESTTTENTQEYPTPPTSTAEASPIVEEPLPSYSGAGSNGVMIILKEPGEAFISDANKAFLGKILGAVGSNLDEVMLYNEASGSIDLSKLIDAHQPKKLLLFGVDLFTIGVKDKNLQRYELGELQGVSVLGADDLASIAANVDKKKALWVNLQRLFGMA